MGWFGQGPGIGTVNLRPALRVHPGRVADKTSGVRDDLVGEAQRFLISALRCFRHQPKSHGGQQEPTAQVSRIDGTHGERRRRRYDDSWTLANLPVFLSAAIRALSSAWVVPTATLYVAIPGPDVNPGRQRPYASDTSNGLNAWSTADK